MNGSCGPCAGARPDATAVNPPGQDALVHPAGRHGSTLAAMVGRLSSADHPDLRGLRTRDPDDPALALLDAWACLSDVLSFYHERLLNEAYLRPCTERRSAVELARLVGYEPRPGVAADVYLAFTLDDSNKESPYEVPVGTRAFSQPGVGETMQPFETVEPLSGRPRWSAIHPNLTRPQRLAANSDRIYLAGVTTGLRPGDALLFALDEHAEGGPVAFKLRKVLRIETEMTAQRTLVLLQPLADDKLPEFAPAPVPVLSTRAVAGLIAPPAMQTESPATLTPAPGAVFSSDSFAPLDLMRSIYPALRESLTAALNGTAAAASTDRVTVYAMRVKAAPRGHNAPKSVTTTSTTTTKPGGRGRSQVVETDTTFTASEWPLDPSMAEPRDRFFLDLDAVYDQIAPQSFVVIERGDEASLKASPGSLPVTLDRVHDVATVSPVSYNLPGRVTRLTLETEWITDQSDDPDTHDPDRLTLAAIRGVTVYAQSEPLELAEVPDDRMVDGLQIALDGVYDGLEPGRRVIVEGERCDLDGVTGVRAAELLLVAGVAHTMDEVPGEDAPPRPGTTAPPAPPEGAIAVAGNPLRTVLTLNDPGLSYRYRRETVTIYANVAHATHGESHAEVLGGGDPTRPLQIFPLHFKPLTYVSDASITGVASTLEVKVNDLRWHEAPDASAVVPDGRQYVVFNDDDGTSRLVFGLGARLPSGRDNVRAVYRGGIGHEGNVRAGQVTVLASQPAGVTGVNNPLAAIGGADRDDVAAIRERAPVGLFALDRLVSEDDYADFARAFGGIAKATPRYFPATRSTPQNTLHVTVAAVDGALLHADAPPVSTLHEALVQYGDAGIAVVVAPCVERLLVIVASVHLLPDFLWEVVRPRTEARLRSVFGFARREFGQDVGVDEVLATIQQVRGVDYAVLERLGAIDVRPDGPPLTPEEIATAIGTLTVSGVTVSPADRRQGAFEPASLAFLSPTVPATLLLTQIEP